MLTWPQRSKSDCGGEEAEITSKNLATARVSAGGQGREILGRTPCGGAVTDSSSAAPSATLGISPACSNARRTAQLRLRAEDPSQRTKALRRSAQGGQL